MKVTIITINGRKYSDNKISNVIERTSGSNGKSWLVLKKKERKDDDIPDRDYLKIALDEVESIEYN